MRSGAELQHAVNGWLQGLLGPSPSAGRARSVTVPSRYEEDQEDDLATAAQSVTRATMGALQKQVRAAGFKGAEVSGWGKGTDGGFTVRYQGQDYRFSISEAQMHSNGRGLYHGTGVSKNDMVIHQDHRGRWRVDLITSSQGHSSTIGTTRGFSDQAEAVTEAARAHHIRGGGEGLLWEQQADGSYSLHYEPGPSGKTARLRDFADSYMPNGSLYEELRAAGCQLDNHESDLYVVDSPRARAILGAHKQRYKAFVSDLDGRTWLDVPFAYEPFWASRQRPNGPRTGILSDGTRVNVYHDPSSTDAYTVVPHSEAWDSMARGDMREMLGTSATGRGFSQWTTGQEGPHLGRKVAWVEVPDELKRHIEQRVVQETMVANASRKVTIETLEKARGSGRMLVCSGCGESYSSDPSDYWQMEPGQAFVCGNCGEPLKLSAKPRPRRPTALEDSWAEDDYVVSVIDRDGTIGLFRIQRGKWQGTEPIAVGYKLDQISGAAEEDAQARGVQDSVVFDGDDGSQIGHVLRGRWQVEMSPNARVSTVDEHAKTELSLYIENEYALIGAPNSIGKSIDTNLRKKVAKGTYDPALAPKAWQHLIDEGARRYAKAFSTSERDATTIFSAATRRAVAADFARAWEAENLRR